MQQIRKYCTNRCIHSDTPLWYFCQHHTTRVYSSQQIQLRCSISRSCPARGRIQGSGILGHSTLQDRNYRLHSERAPTKSGCPWCKDRRKDGVSHDPLSRGVAEQVWLPLFIPKSSRRICSIIALHSLLGVHDPDGNANNPPLVSEVAAGIIEKRL